MTYEVSLVFQLKVKLFYISGFFLFFLPKANLNFKKVFGIVHHLVLYQRPKILTVTFLMFLGLELEGPRDLRQLVLHHVCRFLSILLL